MSRVIAFFSIITYFLFDYIRCTRNINEIDLLACYILSDIVFPEHCPLYYITAALTFTLMIGYITKALGCESGSIINQQRSSVDLKNT